MEFCFDNSDFELKIVAIVACWFNKEKFIEEKDVMLDLLKQLISRFNELNDGSFIIDDKIIEMYDC